MGRRWWENLVVKPPSSQSRCLSCESCTDLLVVPLGDAQVILSTVWLKSLDPTLWNFSNKILQLWKNGKVVKLQGGFSQRSGCDKG